MANQEILSMIREAKQLCLQQKTDIEKVQQGLDCVKTELNNIEKQLKLKKSCK